MIDSHSHLHRCPRPAAELVAEAASAGVHRILTVGLDGADCRTALAVAEDFPQVFAAVGRHPNSATGFDDADRAELQALAAHEQCVAIGETGLDYYRAGATPEDQARAFRAHIALARETAKPLIIHTREAAVDTLAVLEREATGIEVILHCFSMPEEIDRCIAHGWLISFAGNVTYPASDGLRAAAARVPLDRLLVETDAPYLAPVPRRGERNEPAWVVHTAAAVAAARGMEPGDLEAAVDRNAAEVFGW